MNANDMNFTSKERYHYKMIDKYFKKIDKCKINKMISIIDGKSEISLRLLDWFVTSYSNKNMINYPIDDEIFNVHISYKAQLKSYKKRYFDPFRRRKKFYYFYDKHDKSKKLFTTIGQLNFFRWGFSNGVIDYVENNYKDISKAMNIANKEAKIRKISLNSSSSIDKNEDKENLKLEVDKGIFVHANKEINKDKIEIILSFD